MKSNRPSKVSFLVCALLLSALFTFVDNAMAARLIDESFENAGYEESWTESVHTGCTLDEDSLIPGVPPQGAGDQCLHAVVSDATNRDAYAYQTIGNNSISYVRGYIYVDSEGFSDGESLKTLELYDSSNARVTAILIGQLGGDLKLKFQYYSTGTEITTSGAVSLALDTWYRVEYKYDIANWQWEVRIDGVTEASGWLDTPVRTPDKMLVGIHGNSGSASTTLYTDLAGWDDSTWLGEEPGDGTTRTVCQSGGCNYTNIQDALAAAASGDTVKVMDSATYDSTSGNQIMMKSGVDLISDIGVTPTITGTDVPAVTFQGSIDDSTLNGFFLDGTAGCGMEGIVYVDGSTLACTNITISDCELQGYDSPGSPGIGPGIRLNGSVSVSIIENTIYDNVYAGIGCDLSGGGTFDGSVTIKGNVIGISASDTNGTAGIALNGSGGNDQVTIGGLLSYDRNTISYTAGVTGISSGPGMRLENIEQLVIRNNEISHNSSAGMLLLDVTTVSPHILNNDIFDQTAGAGINIGGASQITVGGNNAIYNNQSGVAFFVSTNPDISAAASSEPITISGNDIYGNTFAGIAVRDPITGTVTVQDNNIYQNSRSGIGIRNSCDLDIADNAIYDQIRGGIHTGTDVADPGGFDGAAGSAFVTISKNKVYGNGQSMYGGGIDVRHASGTIYNNLVYENHRGGIRFGDWITDIINNTVSDNGNATEDLGGGIIYDDISLDDAVNDPPDGNPPASLFIRNNISTFNRKAGIRACFTMTVPEERDYNLVYGNFPWSDLTGANEPDCGWPDLDRMSCVNQQYGGCGGTFSPDGTPPLIRLIYPNDIMMDPLFVDRANDNYELQSGSPAISNPGDDGTQRGAYGGTDPIDW